MLSQVLCDKEREEKTMSTFIATMIMKQADISLEKGQAKYRAYFVNTTLYLRNIFIKINIKHNFNKIIKINVFV